MIHGYQMSMDIHGYPRIIHGYFMDIMSVDVHGYPWISMDIHGCPWISMDIHGCPWMSMDIHGYPLISMDIHGYQWIFIVKLTKKQKNLVVWQTRLAGDVNIFISVSMLAQAQDRVAQALKT